MIQIIHDCEQGSEAWFHARLGMATASEFATIMASGRGGAESKGRSTYMRKLAGEIVTGEPQEAYSNSYMDRGHAMEPAARELYAFERDAEPTLVGFISNGRRGCSPDALIGENGLLEIKTKAAHLHIECLLRDEFPPEHKAQCQGALLVSEREWIDLAIYWPKLPLIVKRAYRDEPYLAELSSAIDAFNDELDALVARVRAYGARKAA